jgi:hypothetical protein
MAGAPGEVAVVMRDAVGGGGHIKGQKGGGWGAVGVGARPTSPSAEAVTLSSRVGVAGVAVIDVAGVKVADGGLLVSCNSSWVVYKRGRLFGGGPFCGAGAFLCGVA